MRKDITHLLVDLDGTLVDGDGLPMRLDFISKMIHHWSSLGGGVQASLKAFHRMKKVVQDPSANETNFAKMAREFGRTFRMTQARAEAVLDESIEAVFPKMARHFSPVPGAQEFIKMAHQKYPLYLATQPIWAPAAVELRVKWGQLDLNWFRSYTHSKRMHSIKPQTEYFSELAEQESLDVSQCLLIGDHHRNDLPATLVGIRVFLIDRKRRLNDPQISSIAVSRRAAQAWTGSYTALRRFLDEQLW